jgi:colanic acid/amylovoran biosynthesis glycosyltransferase
MAYLVSQYPKLSMIFITREVLQLRQLGWDVRVASINNADRSLDGLTVAEADEARLAFYVKRRGLVGAARAHALTFATRPVGWLRGLRLAISLGRFDVSQIGLHLAYFSEAVIVGRWMSQGKLGHLHVHLGSQAATVGLYVKRTFSVGLSITVHGPDEFYDVTTHHLRRKVADADFIVCISHFAKSQLMKLSPYEHWSKLVVSRLGIDPHIFTPVPPSTPDQPFEILCIGRLTSAKGQHLLIDVAADLRSKQRSFKIRVVGDGEDRRSLEQLSTSRAMVDSVIFEGAVDQDRIREFYSRADCFCLPSFAEGIPVVLMEAMAMELPCITTHITGIPELITNDVNGLLVAPSDVAGIVQAIERLMDDRSLGRALGRRARERVLTDYNLERNVGSLASIFAERL